MTIILRTIVRNRKAYSKINCKFINETVGGGIRVVIEYHNRNIAGPMKINNDIVELVNPSAIADLLFFFIKFHNLNEEKPITRQKIKSIKNIDTQSVTNSWSLPGFAKKIVYIITVIAKIASKKNIPPKTKYSLSNFLIIFGFSSILYSLYGKYYFARINIFGG